MVPNARSDELDSVRPLARPGQAVAPGTWVRPRFWLLAALLAMLASPELLIAQPPDGGPADIRIELEDGDIVGRVTVRRDGETQAVGASGIPEDVEAIELELRSERSQPTQLYVDFIAVEVFGQRAETRLNGGVELLQPQRSWNLRLWPKTGALTPGDYRIDVAVESGPFESLALQVDPVAPPAGLLGTTPWPPGFNLALADLGGEIVDFSSQYDESSRAAANLIDGFPQIYNESGSASSRGWYTASGAGFPAEVVLAFHQRRAARIEALILDSAGLDYDDPGRPKHVEVLVADDPEETSFVRVAQARLWPVYEAQIIRFEPVTARFVKLRVLSAHDGKGGFGIGELAVIETPGGESILADREFNLARPALGGSIESFTSQDKGNPAWHLVDAAVGERHGWMARAPDKDQGAALPQDFVFSFKHGRSALVDRVIIDAESQPRYSIGDFSDRWPAMVSVAIGNEPGGPFTEVDRVELRREPGPQAISVGQRARLVRVRILDNHGGPTTTAGEIEIIEGSAPGYVSVVAQAGEPAATPAPRAHERRPDAFETNDSAATAGAHRPGEAIEGNLHAYTDVDFFRFALPGDSEQILNIELGGEPSLRTRLELTQPGTDRITTFEPSGNAGQRTVLTWLVPSGEQLLRITDTPLSVALVWDGSGSMAGRMDALEAAVRRYLGSLAEDEQVQLIHFSDRANVLLEDFTGDPETIWPAIEGRFRPDGSTALWDALHKALELLHGRPGRQVVILFTDGHDSASATPLEEVLVKIESASARIYTIGLGAALDNYSQRMGGSGTRFLQRAAQGSNGRYFHAPDTGALEAIFETIAAELRAIPRYTIRTDVSTAKGRLEVTSVGEHITALSPPRFELILDASGSMKQRVADGRTRMDVAKEVLKATVDRLPPDVEVALRTFGRRIREGQAGDCQDTELLVPFGRGQTAALRQSIDEVVALGTTPIAYALEQAIGDLAELDEEALIVLVTDGEEECHPDLQAALAQLQARGIPFRLNVVGFEIGDEAVSAMLETLARQAGGIFVPSGEAGALGEALRQSLSSRFFIEDQDGRQVAAGVVGQPPVELPAGVYRIRVESTADLMDLRDVRIEPDRTTVIELSKAGSAVATSTRIE